MSEDIKLIALTEAQLRNIIIEAVAEGVKRALGQDTEKKIKPTMVNTANAKKMMQLKGYRVSSIPGFISFKKNHNLTATKKGREDWFLVSELEAIPSRI